MDWFLILTIALVLIAGCAAFSDVGERDWDEIDKWEDDNDWKRP